MENILGSTTEQTNKYIWFIHILLYNDQLYAQEASNILGIVPTVHKEVAWERRHLYMERTLSWTGQRKGEALPDTSLVEIWTIQEVNPMLQSMT